MASGTVIIERRYCGPPNSGNGGYVAGRLANFVESEGVEVTLRSPPPLETEMSVSEQDDGITALMLGDQVVAMARPADVNVGMFPRITCEDAEAAAESTIPAEMHALPTCFVCGPNRHRPDGLCIFAGPVDPDDVGWRGVLAAPWVPGRDLAGPYGAIAPEFVWAALDCPSGYALFEPDQIKPILLGRLAATIHSLPRPDEELVVVARRTGRDGRKLFSESALVSADGKMLAGARATWIVVDRSVQVGSS
jgi:hypothetical protein